MSHAGPEANPEDSICKGYFAAFNRLHSAPCRNLNYSKAAIRDGLLLVNSGSSEAEIQRQLAVIQTARNVLVNVGYVAVRLTFARPAVDQLQTFTQRIFENR